MEEVAERADTFDAVGTGRAAVEVPVAIGFGAHPATRKRREIEHVKNRERVFIVAFLKEMNDFEYTPRKNRSSWP